MKWFKHSQVVAFVISVNKKRLPGGSLANPHYWADRLLSKYVLNRHKCEFQNKHLKCKVTPHSHKPAKESSKATGAQSGSYFRRQKGRGRRENGRNGHWRERISGLEWSIILSGLPQWLSGKESTCKAGDMSWNPRLRRSPREGHDNPLQYSCLENSRDRGAWQATVHCVAKSWTWLKRLSVHAHMHTHTHVPHTHHSKYPSYMKPSNLHSNPIRWEMQWSHFT